MLMLLLALLSPAAHADDEAANKVAVAPAPGITHETLEKNVNDNIGKVKACYDNNIKPGEHPGGTVNTRFTVGPDGKVSGVSILSSELKNEKIENCLKDELGKLVFPAPQGGVAVQVDYPFNFSLAKKAEAKGKKKK